MLLEGEALKDFEKWIRKKNFPFIDEYSSGLVVGERIRLTNLDNTFLFCLIVDWLDEVGFHVQVWQDEHNGGFYFWLKTKMSPSYFTRQEARDECIKLASKEYNKQVKNED